MKEILFKNRLSPKKRFKTISFRESSEDKESINLIRKKFIYIVNKTNEENVRFVQPELYIIKDFDSKTNIEKFSFRVKGNFYMRFGRHFFEVDFCHSMKITIKWKGKDFSPKKLTTSA